MKTITILGSTGSVGQNALRIISAYKDKFKLYGLSANSNINLLKRQIAEFKPEVVALNHEDKARELKKSLGTLKKKPRVLEGPDGIVELAGLKKADIVVMAITGSCALRPLLSAIKSSRTIALANKEALVMAGGIVTRQAKTHKSTIIPVDSEHSAIFQCLNGQGKNGLKKIYLTGTGGPLRKLPKSKFASVSPAQAINHPRWKMGKKISVDSATLMNKGLEVIEAKWLFGVSQEKIEIVIHPEAIIHSMVEFVDGGILAQMGITDMRLPILFALSHPDRLPADVGFVNFAELKSLSFEKPNFKKFPCLQLAYQAATEDGTAPCVLNAANEELVGAYLREEIDLTDIPKLLEKVLCRHKRIDNPTLDQLFETEEWARQEIKEQACCQS